MTAPASGWILIGNEADIPLQGARVVRTGFGDIALFRTATGEVLAIEDRCPHRGGPLSQGIVHGDWVTCPLHNWVISLKTGEAQGADSGCVKTIPVKSDGGALFLSLTRLGALTAA
jgi:nitrite reductase [NAD(P)H] small subunit